MLEYSVVYHIIQYVGLLALRSLRAHDHPAPEAALQKGEVLVAETQLKLLSEPRPIPACQVSARKTKGASKLEMGSHLAEERHVGTSPRIRSYFEPFQNGAHDRLYRPRRGFRRGAQKGTRARAPPRTARASLQGCVSLWRGGRPLGSRLGSRGVRQDSRGAARDLPRMARSMMRPSSLTRHFPFKKRSHERIANTANDSKCLSKPRSENLRD